MRVSAPLLRYALHPRPSALTSSRQVPFGLVSPVVAVAAPARAIAPRVDTARQPSRLPSSPRSAQVSHPGSRSQHSAISLSLLTFAAVGAIGATVLGIYWSSAEPHQSSEEKVDPEVHQEQLEMSAPLPPGRPGNLTADQEVKLQQMWGIVLDLIGAQEGPAPANAAQPPPAPPAVQPTEVKKRRRSHLPFFGRKDNDADGDGSTQGTADIDLNDKHGQKQEFQHVVASYSKEQLRDAFWTETKQDNPDAFLLRFLRARKWDVNAAIVMMFSSIGWNIETKTQEDIVFHGEGQSLQKSLSTNAEERKEGEDFMTQLRMGKSFLHGIDVDGRPCCFARARMHRQGEQDEKSLERFTIHTIETARMMLRSPVDTATIVFDLSGFSLANMDYAPVKFMIKCFEANYPESLGRVIVYKAPWLFQGVWKIIKGWLDPVVAGKIVFVSDSAGLLECIPKQYLMTEYGGEDPYTYKYEEPLEGENDAQKDTAAREGLQAKRMELARQYEAATRKWIATSDRSINEERSKITSLLTENYWQLDPYVRARSLYDRIGVIKPGGELDFSARTVPNHAEPSG